jgi:DNA polymerase-4
MSNMLDEHPVPKWLDELWLVEHLGQRYGMWLRRVSVVTHSEPVPMSRESTFERNIHPVRDREDLGSVFTRLCEQVAADLQLKGYVSRKIGIKLRFDDCKTVTRDLNHFERNFESCA